MRRCGNGWNNSAAELFFSSLNSERVRNRIYRTREEARSDVFDCIEVLYNRQRRHGHVGGVSPVWFETAASNG